MKRVLIIGAGVAGKLAARLLRDQFDQVTLIDREMGKVFQSGQLHVMLGGGMEILKRHFPLTFETMEKTCPSIDWGGDSYWNSPVGVVPSKANGVITHTCTRGYLDQLMLEEITADGIEMLEAKVVGLIMSDDEKSVLGVKTSEGDIFADMVVDAMGRTTKMHQWLEAISGEAVKTSRLDTTLQYTTAMGRFETEGDYQQAYLQIDPQSCSYGGVILPVEENKVIATSVYIEPERGEMFSHITDVKFNEIAGRLKLDDERRKISKLHNVTYHYERYTALPSNLYLIGDSVCQFNPVFGQGMTQAMRGAELLAHYLKGGVTSHSFGFQKQLKKDLFFPWMMATMDPYNSEVKLSLFQRITRWWGYKQMKLAQKNEDFREVFIRVLHMMDSPFGLYRFKWLIRSLVS